MTLLQARWSLLDDNGTMYVIPSKYRIFAGKLIENDTEKLVLKGFVDLGVITSTNAEWPMKYPTRYYDYGIKKWLTFGVINEKK